MFPAIGSINGGRDRLPRLIKSRAFVGGTSLVRRLSRYNLGLVLQRFPVCVCRSSTSVLSPDRPQPPEINVTSDR